MPSEVVDNINGILLNYGDREDLLRGIFFQARNHVQKEISEMLADFRSKRSLGKWTVCVCGFIICCLLLQR